MMDGWQDYLHFSLLGEHVLFQSLRLDSPWLFIAASLLTSSLCLSERALTYAITKNWSPFPSTQRSRLRTAAWKTSLYWLVTFIRLLYMLIAMTFSAGLIVVAVSALSIGQFVIEYNEAPTLESRTRRDLENVKEPLLHSPTSYEPSMALHSYPSYRSSKSPTLTSYSRPSSPFTTSPSSQASSLIMMSHSELPQVPTQPPIITRPRSKSKPTSIFIHPSDSNLARADAAALELGIGGDTDLVKGNQYPARDESAWELGKGKDIARELMGVKENPI